RSTSSRAPGDPLDLVLVLLLLSAAPPEKTEEGEEDRDARRERPLDVRADLAAGGLVLLVLLALRGLVVLRADLRVGDVVEFEVRLLEELRAGREQIGVAADPVERVLDGKDRVGEVTLPVLARNHQELPVAAGAAEHGELLAEVGPVARVGEGVRQE